MACLAYSEWFEVIMERNVEVQWLLDRLQPNYHSISDLITGLVIAMDGTNLEPTLVRKTIAIKRK